MSQALYRKWRPHLWEQVIGQEHIVRTLQNAIRTQRVGHAYLFAGPRGTGKTTTARLLAKAVNCLAEDPANRPCDQCDPCKAVNEGRFMDLIEIDAASNTSVDDVRDLREKINFSPSQGSKKVYIIDEVHMLSTAGFNALLKTLEEPPPHAIFILATTEVHKIPATVLSRCQRHEFRRLPVNDIVKQLQLMASGEGLSIENEALTLIARQATGSMRDAISLLDQLSSTGETITLATAQAVLGTATNQLVIELVEATLQQQAGAGLDTIHRALDNGTDPRQFARQVVDYLRSLLLIKMNNASQVDAAQEVRVQMAQQAKSFELANLLESLRLYNDAASDRMSSGWQPGLLLELALAQSLEPLPTAQPLQTVLPAQSVQPIPAQAQSHSHPAQTPSTPQTAPVHKPEISTAKAEQAVQPAAPHTTDTKPEQNVSTTPSAASPQPAGSVSLNDVMQNWARICALVKKKRSQTVGLLNSCKPLALKDDKLIIGFATEVLKQKMEMGDHLQITRESVQQVLGVDLPVRCVVMNSKAGALPADLDMEGDGIVGTALNMGAEIVHRE